MSATQHTEIYDRKQRYNRRTLSRFNNLPESENKRLISLWQNHLYAQGCGDQRVSKVTAQMCLICSRMQATLARPTVLAVDELLANLQKSDRWTLATKADFKRALKQFYRWYEDHDEHLLNKDARAVAFYKHLKKNVSCGYKIPNAEYSTIITEKDLYVLMDKGCVTSKSRAFLHVLHESGFRIGEMLGIKFKDLNFKNTRVLVTVDGKTGVRTIPLVQSVGSLQRWIQDHPDNQNSEAYLWTNISSRNTGKPLRYGGVCSLLKTVVKRSGFNTLTCKCGHPNKKGTKVCRGCEAPLPASVKKKTNAHWFRHSRATINAEFMTEQTMCKFFGWAIGSDMPRRYCHVGDKQVENAVLNMYGIKSEERKAKELLHCACGLANRPQSRYCQRCGKPLNLRVVMEDEAKKDVSIDEAFKALREIMMSPKRFKAFQEYVSRTQESPADPS